MTQQTARSEKTRQRIMSYAMRIFFERGFRRITVEEICTGVAISKRTFYKYFSNRDALVEAIVIDRMGGTGPKLLGNLQSDKPVRQILKDHYEILTTEVFQQVSSQMMFDIQTLMPDLWNNIVSFRQSIFEEIGRLIRRGQADGSLRRDMDPEIISRLLQGILNRIASPDFANELGLSMDQMAASLMKILWSGMLSPESEGVEK
ncbi:MAG TPA: TetR/AcrR family transcriptional regulator [bacterium]|nr:TetR/AcrR family transcriptional regulator [bacterium]